MRTTTAAAQYVHELREECGNKSLGKVNVPQRRNSPKVSKQSGSRVVVVAFFLFTIRQFPSLPHPPAAVLMLKVSQQLAC